MSETSCILCGTNTHARVLYPATVTAADLNARVFSARRAPDRVHGEILRCDTCGLVYPRSLPDPQLLASLYRESAFTYGDQEPFIRRTYARYLRRLTDLLADQPHPWSYLDIGCGNGFMLESAHECGFATVTGIEPSSDAAQKAKPEFRDRVLEGMFPDARIADTTLDAITCFQTLDHIPDPISFVQAMWSALKPGGAVLCINHNIGSLTARLLGERCPMIDIEHTFLHTPSTMRALFEREGFTDIRTFAVRNDYPLRYWLHLLPVPGPLRKVLQGIAWVTGTGNLILPLYAGNLGLIARRSV